MEPENEMRTELQDRLTKLHREISQMRERGASQENIELRTADFEMQWQERLALEQKAETRGRQIEAREQILAQDRDARLQAGAKDNALMRDMTPEDQIAYWEHAPSRGGVRQEHELAQKVTATFERIATETTEKYGVISHALTRALMEIENGREPHLTLTGQIAQQIENEQRQAEKITQQREAALTLINRERENQRAQEREL